MKECSSEVMVQFVFFGFSKWLALLVFVSQCGVTDQNVDLVKGMSCLIDEGAPKIQTDSVYY